MKEEIIAYVKDLFESGRIKGFVALKEAHGHIGPHVFYESEDLDCLSLGDKDSPGDARYPLIRVVANLQAAYPRDTYAVLVRGCNERAYLRLAEDERVKPINPDHIIPVGFSCPEELALECQCHKPYPDALVAGEPTPGVQTARGEEPEADLLDQMDEWLAIMNRCVKCFGCRDICPVCECKECTVEREVLVPQRELPPDPSFLLTRAVHMVDRCVFCGLCENVCPAHIPLKELYRLVAKSIGWPGSLPGAEGPSYAHVADIFGLR